MKLHSFIYDYTTLRVLVLGEIPVYIYIYIYMNGLCIEMPFIGKEKMIKHRILLNFKII